MSKPLRKLTKKEKAKDSYLRRTYHTTIYEYWLVLKFQKGRCAICKRLPTDFKTVRAFAVDHCHKTGLIRGLLCMECNRALGKWKDDSEKVINAAQYITNPPMTCSLGAPRYSAPHRLGTKIRAKKLAEMRALELNLKKGANERKTQQHRRLQ